MFGDINDFLDNEATLVIDSTGKPTDEDIRLAIVVLLVSVAYADQNCCINELVVIIRAMATEFALTDKEIAFYLEVAEGFRKDQEKCQEFLDVLKTRFTTQQKQLILAMIWRVVNADGEVDFNESMLTDQIRLGLELTPDEERQARLMAEASIV